jgi:glycosyltransferase involved in cell wall biosynthesis
MALAAGRAAGTTPIVVTYHAGDMKKGRLVPDVLVGIYQRRFLPKLLGKAAAVICSSDQVRGYLSRWADKTVTITPAVDTAEFHPDPSKVTPGRVLFVGDFRDPRKGLGVLLAAVDMLPQVQLHVVGQGEGRPQERVTYTGVLTGEALISEYQAAEVLVLPSTTEAESFGMVLVEAMATGTAVVGSKVGGISLVVDDGRNGLLVAPGDTQALAEALSSMLSDRARLAEMARSGRLMAMGKFSWDTRGQATDAVLREAA